MLMKLYIRTVEYSSLCVQLRFMEIVVIFNKIKNTHIVEIIQLSSRSC